MELYAQNTNLWGAIALMGVGWEFYNIFFLSPDASPTSQASGVSDTDNGESVGSDKWMHASAISVSLLSFWQSQTEINNYEELSAENEDLKGEYQNSTSEAEVVNIKNKIASNQTKMASHISNANIFDGITVIALGVESYLLWKTFADPDSESAELRFQNSN